MSRAIIAPSVRILPRNEDFLDRKVGSRGEIFFDRTSNTLRLYDGDTTGGISLAKDDLTNVSNADFLAKATAAGVGGAGINSFSTVAVSGQSNVVADSGNDTLTLVAGTNVTITTNATNDTITFSATGSGGSSNSFATISVPGQNNIIAESSTDILNIIPGNDIEIITTGKNIIINSRADFTISVAADDSTIRSVSAGESIKFIGSGSVTTSSDAEGNITITGATAATNFSSLTDVATATMTVDQIYLPCITMLYVTNNATTAYRFDQYGTSNNPTVYAISGTTIAFELAATGHPFLIQTPAGENYNTGLIHVATNGTVSTEAAAQGKDSGVLYWKIPIGTTGNYRYQCGSHVAMVGNISIKNFVSI